MSVHVAQQRRQYIANELVVSGEINAKEMSEKFGVSTETIRKDLKHLENLGIAHTGYGGAVVANVHIADSYAAKGAINSKQKQLLAQKAVQLIPENAVLFLDGGSTTIEIARLLLLRNGLTIFTNHLEIARLLMESENIVYLLGGRLLKTSSATYGQWSTQALSEIKADIAFLGSSGFEKRNGPCVENFEEAEVKRCMIAQSEISVVVADSSKAKSVALVEFCKWEDIDMLITNPDLDKNLYKELKKKLVVVLAEEMDAKRY